MCLILLKFLTLSLITTKFCSGQSIVNSKEFLLQASGKDSNQCAILSVAQKSNEFQHNAAVERRDTLPEKVISTSVHFYYYQAMKSFLDILHVTKCVSNCHYMD